MNKFVISGQNRTVLAFCGVKPCGQPARPKFQGNYRQDVHTMKENVASDSQLLEAQAGLCP